MTNNMSKIIKEGVYLEDDKDYRIECYDGYAIATNEEGESIRLEYPKLKEVLSDADMAYEVLKYNGLYDLKPSDLNYGDIMMCYGKPIKEYENS